MGEPLMIQEATTLLANARIYGPVGMICLTLGILAVMFTLFRGGFRHSREKRTQFIGDNIMQRQYNAKIV